MKRTTTSITCDFCQEDVGNVYSVYATGIREGVGYGTWEGARFSWEFCSDDHLRAWLDQRDTEQPWRRKKGS